MYRKEINERSPLRVFESSLHGGLGKGNLGVIAAAAGVGKKALLVQIALDDLLRDRKVLHISHDHPVDRERSYYDELFHNLAETTHLEDPEGVRTLIERNRLIYSHLGRKQAGNASPMEHIRETVRFAREVAHFEPDVMVVGGFDFAHATADIVRDLAALAKELQVELWAAARTTAARPIPGKLPDPLEPFRAHIHVVVYLEPERDVVRLRLLKDHENPDVAALHLRLDPHTMRVIDEDMPGSSVRRRDPKRVRLLSGGSRGAEAFFGACAEQWGVQEVNYTFEGHRLLERKRGVVVLDEVELRKGDFSLQYVSKRLGRVLSDIPLVRNVLQSIWHQINQARQVFVVGALLEDGHVKGGTGWGAELSRIWKKPLWVYDQTKKSWFTWTGKAWEMSPPPAITADAFAGIGTQHLTDDGKQAIRDLFSRSFPAR